MRLLILLTTALALSQAPPLTKAEQLQDASRKGDAAAVKALLDGGLDVNTKFRYDATALFYACDAGNVEVVKVLLDKGADLTGKDTFYGFTPLMLAVSPARKKTPAHKEVAKLLIAKGAPGKDMVLGIAVSDGDADMVKVILDAGPLPAANLSDALEAAKTAKKDDIVALLEKAGAKPFEEFAIDAAQLAKLAGTYKNAGGTEFVVVVNGTRLAIGPAAAPPAQRATLIAKDATSFRVTGAGAPGTAVFKIESDKVTGVTLTIGPQNIVLTRVEGK